MSIEQKREAFLAVIERVRAIAPNTWCMEDELPHIEDELRVNAAWYASLEHQRREAKASIASLNAGGAFQSKPFSILRF